MDYSDDEAYLSRAAFKFLYEIAERNPPSWMPLNQTLEEVYDPGAVKLLKALIDKRAPFNRTVMRSSSALTNPWPIGT